MHVKRKWSIKPVHRFCTLVLLLVYVNSQAQKVTPSQLVIPVVKVHKISMDGKFSQSDWQKAHRVRVNEEFLIYFLASEESLFIGVFGNDSATHYTDIYVRTDKLVNLHASMQLGERVLPEHGHWDDNVPVWKWGNNADWRANHVTYKTNATESQPFKDQIVHYQGQEFEIALSKLNPEFKLFIHIRDFINEKEQVTYPLTGDPYNPESWLEVNIKDK